MSYSAFMPSWAAVLRERYIEKSRQQPHPRRTQTYYYEIHRKSVAKSNKKSDHDLSTCPYVPSKQQNAPKAPDPATSPSNPMLQSVAIRLLPVYDVRSAGGILYKPVSLVPDPTLDIYVPRSPMKIPPVPDTTGPTPTPDSYISQTHYQQPKETTDRDLQSTMSEYGCFHEDLSLPIHQERSPYIHHAVMENPYPVSPSLHSPRVATATHRRPTVAPHRYEYREYPDMMRHGHTQSREHYNPHHEGCPCHRCARESANHYRQNHPGVHDSHRPSSSPRPANTRHYESPDSTPSTRYTSHQTPRFSVHAKRRPSYTRRRTPSPRNREI